MLNEIFTFPQELSFEIITLFMTPQVGRGHSAHLLESHVQCASKPSLPKLMCDATLMRCIVVCEGTPSHPASPHAPASPSHWKSRLPERAAMPRQHVATAPSPPLWTLKHHLQTKTKPNLRLSSRPRHRQTRHHAAARSARGITAHR